MSDDPHATAILDLLKANANLGASRVFDGKVPDGNTQTAYVVVHVHQHRQLSDQLTLPSGRAVNRAVCHSVGSTAAASRIVAGNVRMALLDVTPTVAGRTCFPIRHEQSVPPTPDESTGELVMAQMDVYRLDSEPG